VGYELIALTAYEPLAVAQLYATIFAGPVGFELEKCSHCGRPYPGAVSSRPAPDAEYTRGMPCWNGSCGRPLELVSFYEHPNERLAERIIADAVARDAFVGFAAKAGSGELIGFAWGYRLPTSDGPSVDFSSLSGQLAQVRLDPETSFYAAELGVAPSWQRTGVGRALVRARFRAAIAQGFARVCFRTLDQARVLRLYATMFGEGYVRELFPDPDPAKSQVWYAADFSGFLSL
jgi:GNAT superfamily N-acetyltransferase